MCSLGWASPAVNPIVRISSGSMSGPVGNPGLRGDVGLAIVVIIDVVVNLNRAKRKEQLEVHIDPLRQPDLGKRLMHRHARVDVGQPGQPLTGKEVPAK